MHRECAGQFEVVWTPVHHEDEVHGRPIGGEDPGESRHDGEQVTMDVRAPA